jgi:type VI secretion system secreted protein VgrG
MAVTQDKQRIKLDTPLGKDIFLVRHVSGHEAVSKPFGFTFDVVSELDVVDQKKLIGKHVSCSIKCQDGSDRYFSGIVSSLAAGGLVDSRFRQYKFKIVPWMSLLSYRADCRIFQEKPVPDIVSEVFKNLGFNDFTWKLQGTYSPREYCVQYRETDFDFVTRLLEEEGIYYFFIHESNKHTLVLSDFAKAYEKAVLDPIDMIEGSHTDHKISAWQHSYNFCSGAVSHTDYDFQMPSTSLMSAQQTIVELPNIKQFEQYDFPGAYIDKASGDAIARNRMESIETTYSQVSASSDYPNLAPGYSFKVGRHIDSSEVRKKYVIASITHRASEGSYRAGDEGAFAYTNDFNCIPDEMVMRPLRTMAKPYIAGSQTAVVAGPSSEEIYTDKYGRIKVQFFWDRLGKKDENSSCWIRVAQSWSGKKWGAQFLPRVGQEVLISFLEGDPDRPIVVGSVYNAEQMPTYDLPANKATSGIKTRSTKGGGTENYNELRFVDEKGKELFYIHAEKDEQEVVENNQTVSIGNDQSITIGNDQTISVGNDSSESIGHDCSQTVGNNKTLSVGANHSESVDKMMSVSVGENRTLDVGKNQTINVGNNQDETIGKNSSLTVGEDLTESIGGKHSESVTKEYALSAKKILLSADDEILIKVGSAKISMKKNGDITISGGKINVKGSGAITVKGSKINQN